MSQENKDRLEDFFKKNTEKYHFEFNEADWEKMEAKLDEAEKDGAIPPVKNNGARFYLFGLILFLLIAGFFSAKMYLTGGKGTEKTVPSQSYASADEGVKSGSSVEVENYNSGQQNPSRQKSGENVGSMSPLGSDNSGNLEDISLAAESQNENLQTNEVPWDKGISSGYSGADKRNSFRGKIQASAEAGELDSTHAAEPSNDSDLSSHKVAQQPPAGSDEKRIIKTFVSGDLASAQETNHNVAVSQIAQTDLPGKTNEQIDEDPGVQVLHHDRATQEVIFLVPYGLATNDFQPHYLSMKREKVEETAIEESDLVQGENHVRRLLSVGFSVAPDFSTVGIGDYTRPGTRYGLLVDYHLGNRFAFHTGAIVANNIYTASGEEYHAPEGYWAGGVKPISAEGKCKIVDIPLNIRYNVITTKKGQIFASTGLTSYIMLKEKYWFGYDNSGYNYNDNKSSWESKDVTKHWFGLVNLSAGYERFVAERWSVQIEPFANLPITGIGWGKVDLYSVGMYLSLKYHWNKK